MGLKATIAILRDQAVELMRSEENEQQSTVRNCIVDMNPGALLFPFTEAQQPSNDVLPTSQGGEHESRTRPALPAYSKDACGEGESRPTRRDGLANRCKTEERIERLLADRSIGRRRRSARYEALLDLW